MSSDVDCMAKVLSVVIPTYNMESLLDRCLSSFLLDERHMAMLEVLVINDGSKDNSSQIAHGFESRYPDTYRVIDKENGNYGSCVNRGLMEATGHYFRILDADDWYDFKALSSFLDRLCELEADLVITPFNFIGDKSILFTFSDQVSENEALPVDEVNADDIVHRMHSMTFCLDALKKCSLHLSEGVSYTDTEYCFYPIGLVKTVAFVRETVYQYNASRDGQTCSPEAMVRSTRSMCVVAGRLLRSYLDGEVCENSVADVIRQRLLVQITQLYYETSLLFCSSDDDGNLKEIDDIVRKIPFLDTIIDKRRRHHVHYVRMWREKGHRYSSRWLCQFHETVWEKAVPGTRRFFKSLFKQKR